MELVLIRHAEPGRPDDPVERQDPGLGERGGEQAALMADRFGREEWDAIYSSPQRRAAQTAEVLAGRLGMAVRLDDGLAEFDYGKPYLHLEDLMKSGNSQMEAFRREDFSAYGTDADTIRRTAVTAIEAIVAAHPGQRVAIFSHGAVINAFIGSFIGATKLVFHHPSYTGASTVLASRRGHRELVRLNDSVHLRLPWPAPMRQETP